MIVIIILCMLDYILTYIGIHLKIICEGNPLMIWLFNLNFITGFLIRLLMVVILLIPFYLCNIREHKFYNLSVKIIILIYIPIIILHLKWIKEVF